ncbi:hypothetical protein TNCV_4642641 [Trichonephila clavipes]|nr:hypothetical protein TNCV_4642641 [Trichonephila clavipes]
MVSTCGYACATFCFANTYRKSGEWCRKHQLHYGVACGEIAKQRNSAVFESEIIEGARSVRASISKTVALVECSRVAIINVCVYKEWIPKQKTMSQCQAYGRRRLLKAHSEKRIMKVVKSTRRETVLQIAWNLNQGAIVNVSEGTVRRTINCCSQQPVLKPLLMRLNGASEARFSTI